MLTIEKLKDYGANVEEGLSRCLGNEDFYIRLVNLALADGGFDRLSEAVKSADMTASFEAAHALKGMLGNLALTPMFAPASEMTELLRSREAADYETYLQIILEQRDKLAALAAD